MLALGFFFLFSYLAPRVAEYIETNQIPLVEIQIGPILIYFFAVVIILGVVLFLIPVRYLKYILKLLFAVLYAWERSYLDYPCPQASIAIGVASRLSAWYPRLWLQNVLLLLT
jgi:hypothetical protein